MGIYLEGTFSYLAEVEEKYFPYIIAWRNDPENNQFINQPFVLDEEKQRAWYERYCADDTQALLVMVAKEGDVPFGTVGWTYYNPEERICVPGRFLVGNHDYRASTEFLEVNLLHMNYLYDVLQIEHEYIHVVKANRKALSFNKSIGFRENAGVIRFPQELCVNGMEQIELHRGKEQIPGVRAHLTSLLNVFRQVNDAHDKALGGGT